MSATKTTSSATIATTGSRPSPVPPTTSPSLSETTEPPGPITTTRNNLGPLTTVFTPPAYCTSCFFDPLSGTGSTLGQCQLFKSRGMCTTQSLPECLPGAYDYLDLAESGAGPFYSPGLECPSGWKTVALVSSATNYFYPTAVNGVNPNTLIGDETAAVCCPSAMTYIPQAFHCVGVSAPASSMYLTCSRSGLFTTQSQHGGIYYLSYRDTTTSVYFPFIGSIAPAIQLNYQSGDRTSTSTTSSSTLPPTTASTSGVPTNNPGPVAQPLSGGAIAGIVVGVVTFLAIVGGFIFWIWRRRRAKRAALEDDDDGFRKAELDGTNKPKSHFLTEMGNGSIYELDVTDWSGRPELAGDHSTNELPGDYSNNELPGDHTNNELSGDSLDIARHVDAEGHDRHGHGNWI